MPCACHPVWSQCGHHPETGTLHRPSVRVRVRWCRLQCAPVHLTCHQCPSGKLTWSMSQWDVGEMEATMWAWCPKEQRERMRFAVTECSAVDWGGVHSHIPCTRLTFTALALFTS